MKKLAAEVIQRIPELTVQRSATVALENARANFRFIRRTIGDLGEGEGCGSVIVVAAGPSLHLKDPAPLIRKSGYQGRIVATDGALGYCLRHDIVPDYVVTLDPHPTRISRWFGDPGLESRKDDDDYFRRQDLDPHLNTDEAIRNQELIELVNRHGPRIRATISTSVSPAVTARCLESGMNLYWWNPIMDDVQDPQSMTRQLFNLNNAPCMVTGGNVGSAAWVFAHQILRAKEVILVGLDLGYAPDTPYEKTQYYREMQELFEEQVADAFISVYNPYLKETWYTDPAYFWYRKSLLEMATQAPCTTYNCTEGGILFGKGIRFVPLSTVLHGR